MQLSSKISPLKKRARASKREEKRRQHSLFPTIKKNKVSLGSKILTLYHFFNGSGFNNDLQHWGWNSNLYDLIMQRRCIYFLSVHCHDPWNLSSLLLLQFLSLRENRVTRNHTFESDSLFSFLAGGGLMLILCLDGDSSSRILIIASLDFSNSAQIMFPSQNWKRRYLRRWKWLRNRKQWTI